MALCHEDVEAMGSGDAELIHFMLSGTVRGSRDWWRWKAVLEAFSAVVVLKRECFMLHGWSPVSSDVYISCRKLCLFVMRIWRIGVLNEKNHLGIWPYIYPKMHL